MTNTAFYNRLIATANRLLKDKGQAVTIKTATLGTYDPTTGTVASTTSTQYGYGAIVDWDSRHIDGNLILVTDKRLLLSPLNTAGVALTVPKLGDTITDAAGIIYTITAPFKPLSPGGTIVLFDCNLRV